MLQLEEYNSCALRDVLKELLNLSEIGRYLLMRGSLMIRELRSDNTKIEEIKIGKVEIKMMGGL